MEIERNLNMIEVKNVAPTEIDTLQDGHVLTSGDLVGSEPISSLTEKVDAAHAKEETESTQSNDDSNESSAESDADEGDMKFGVTKSKSSTSQEVRKLKGNTLI